MRRTRVALIVSLVWLAATVAGGAGLTLLPLPAGAAIALAVTAAAFTLSLLLARRIDREVQEKLVRLATAVGAADSSTRDSASIEAIIANLAGRLERASQFKTAFSGLERPVILASAEGEILGASRGLLALAAHAGEGTDISTLLGDGYAAGGMRADEMVTIGGLRFIAHHRAAGAGRRVVEFVPAGAYIADDDLDAFASALVGGQTGLRFDAQALAASPALRALEEGLVSLDVGVEALNRLLAGEPIPDAARSANSGIAPQVRELADLVAALQEDRDQALEARAQLERKCTAVLDAIDKYRTGIAVMAELADSSREGATAAGESLDRGRLSLEAAQDAGREARIVLVSAGGAAERADRATGTVERVSVEIDKLVAAIEDVSFRTNLLALNAAVEAARAGEKGAGFAVVAEEVRMLAQLTQKSSRDIRQLVGTTREQSAVGASEAAGLRDMLDLLTRHLEIVSTETDRVGDALEEGSAAMGRLETEVTTLGEAAASALALPARRAERAAVRA